MPSLPKMLAKELRKQKVIGFGPLTLARVTPGSRTPGSLADGNNPTTTLYPCSGRLGATASTVVQGGTLVRVKNLSIFILGDTLPTDVTPKVGDTITRNGITYAILADGVLNEDGLGAIYECMCRKAG